MRLSVSAEALGFIAPVKLNDTAMEFSPFGSKTGLRK
jgi:hypothetical protein